MTADHQTIEAFIKAKLAAHHRGKENAIKSHNLLWYLQEYVDPRISHRKMRKAYENIPRCGTNAGLYVPATEAEKAHQIAINTAKIKAHARNSRALRNFNIPPEPRQKELFA